MTNQNISISQRIALDAVEMAQDRIKSMIDSMEPALNANIKITMTQDLKMMVTGMRLALIQVDAIAKQIQEMPNA